MVQDPSGVFNPIHFGRSSLRKQSYILFVARGKDGQLRKIPISLNYLYVLVAGIGIGMLSLTGIAGSYTRMLVKVHRFNQLRTEKEQLTQQYTRLEQSAWTTCST